MSWVLVVLCCVVLPVGAQWCEVGRIAALNSSGDDFAPVWDRQRGQLLLSSTRGGVSRIYSAVWHDTGWSPPRELPGLAVPGHHLCCAAPAPDGWLYVCRYHPGRRQAYLQVTRVRQEPDGSWRWDDVPELRVGAEEAFTAHPTIAPDGSFMVFASDRPGGQGGTDLWICFRQADGSWSLPENLRLLNSPGNEITPYLASVDTLFFASNGHGGAGGYDLFISVRRWDGQWQAPEPLVELNTAADESDFCLLPFGEMALFVRRFPQTSLDIVAARRCEQPLQAPARRSSGKSSSD
jgi:hypothetical protein